MKSKVKLLFGALLICFGSTAQESGYFGKNTFLEIDGFGQLPVFTNIFHTKGYANASGKLKESYNLLDYSFRASLSTVIDEYTSSGLEFGLKNYFINPQKGDEVNRQVLQEDGTVLSESVNAKAAMIPIQEIQLMTKALFSSSSRVPSGISHEVGVGYCMIRIMDQHPLVEVGPGAAYDAAEISDNFVDQRMTEMKGLVFSYGIRMNYPITRSLLFHYGFKYQYNMMLGKKKYKDYEYSDAWFSGREIWSTVNQRRQLGIMSFGMGLTLCF